MALQSEGLKKTGENKYSGYNYFELGDFLPKINELMLKSGLCSKICFTDTDAVLTIVDADKPEDTLTFTSPIASAQLKGCHDIQNLGAVQTYLRRYLWITAMEISEHDTLDAVTGKAQTQVEPKTDYRSEIAKMLIEMSNGNKEQASKMLELYTAFEGKNGHVDGKKSTRDLSEKQLAPTYGKVKAEYLAFRGGQNEKS